MKAQLPDSAANILRDLIALLVHNEYGELERRSNGVRMSARDLERAVEDYGRRLIALPEAAWELTDAIVVAGDQPLRYSVRQPLWTEEEGRSDLTFELTLIESSAQKFDIEIDDLHVL